MKLKSGLIIVLMGLTGCGNINLLSKTGNGEIETYVFSIKNSVTSLEVGIANFYNFSSQSVVVNCYENEAQYVEMRVDSNLKDDILVNQYKEKLVIKKNGYQQISFKRIEINVYGCKFDDIELSNATTAYVDKNCLTENVNLSLSGASDISCGFTSFISLSAHLSGASKATIKGSSKYFNCGISGASLFDGKGFETEEGYISLSGASKATLNVSGSLYGSVSGASKLQYSGSGNVDVDTSGASSVEEI